MLEKFDSGFAEIWTSGSPWIGIVSLRTTTEALLLYRLRIINPRAARNCKSLKNMEDALGNLDNSPREVMTSISIIRQMWGHTKSNTMEEYMVALQKFVDILTWHKNNPPEATGS